MAIYQIRIEEVTITSPRRCADGVWRASPTDQTRTEYVVLADGQAIARTPSEQQARLEIDKRRFWTDPESAAEAIGIFYADRNSAQE